MSHPFLGATGNVARDLIGQWQEAVASAAVQLSDPAVSAWALLDTAENYTWVADARRRMPSRPEDDAQACVVPVDNPCDIPDPISDSSHLVAMACCPRQLALRSARCPPMCD